MKCPFCEASEISVIDTRDVSDTIIRRRRECDSCKQRFTTYEKVGEVEFFVIKRDGSKEKFDKDKIKRGLISACKKRPVTVESIEELISKVVKDLKLEGNLEITSEQIGALVMKYLKDLDEVAYIRFASIYKAFGNANDFKKEILKL